MTTRRCVCPICSGYINSADDSYFMYKEDFEKDWAIQCDEFLSCCCPHNGDGYENEQKWRLMQE